MTKYDYLKIIVISDCKKTYLEEKYRPRSIQQEYRDALKDKVLAIINKVQPSHYSIEIEEKSHKFEDVKIQICYLSSKLSATYIFIGSFGRKGDK